MVNCLHYPEDVECITLYLVVFLALVVTCVIVAGIYRIVKRILKQRRDNLKCADENHPHVLTEANTQDTDEQKTANHVSQTSKTKDNREQVFVLLKDDILRVCIDALLKGTGLIPNYFHFDNEQTVYENGKFKFEDETSTIIVVRHGSTRIDSDVAGCCKPIAESDMKRTVVVIINEYANNKKGEHGEIIKPNSYVIDNINDLKNVVVFNYKCCIAKKKCKRCKDAFDEFKQHASSPNYK